MKRKVIDLSMEIYERMPIYPIHQKAFCFVNQTHEQSRQASGASEVGFEAHNWLISEHCGTHSDSVYEYDPKGDSIEKMPLEYFYGAAMCLDISHIRYPDWITPQVLQQALDKAGLAINKGDIVLLHTGHYGRTHDTPQYVVNYTGLTEEAADWLARKGVVNIGVDTASIDHTDDPEFVGHKICGKYKITNTENLVNLDKVAGKRFMYHGLPLKFRNGSGSPIRAIAFLEE
jgi:kynurenine formamidase